MARSNFTNFFDISALLDVQRKNIEALSEAQILAFEGLRAVAQRQTEILSQIVEDTSSMVKEIMGDGKPTDKMDTWAGLAEQVYDRSVMNWHGQSVLIGESGKAAADIINNRISSSFIELENALKKRANNESSIAKKKAA